MLRDFLVLAEERSSMTRLRPSNLHSIASLNCLLPFFVMVLKPCLRTNVSVKACTGFLSFNFPESSASMAFLMSSLHKISRFTVSNVIGNGANTHAEIENAVYHLAVCTMLKMGVPLK